LSIGPDVFNVLQSRLHTNRIFNSLVLESDKHMIQLNKFPLQERRLSPLLLPVRTKMQFYTSLSRAGVRKIKQFYPNSKSIPNSSFSAPPPPPTFCHSRPNSPSLQRIQNSGKTLDRPPKPPALQAWWQSG